MSIMVYFGFYLCLGQVMSPEEIARVRGIPGVTVSNVREYPGDEELKLTRACSYVWTAAPEMLNTGRTICRPEEIEFFREEFVPVLSRLGWRQAPENQSVLNRGEYRVKYSACQPQIWDNYPGPLSCFRVERGSPVPHGDECPTE